MRIYLINILFFAFGICTVTNAQDKPVVPSQKPLPSVQDSTISPIDTSIVLSNQDSIPSEATFTVNISKDSPDAPIDYNAEDSIHTDIKNNKVYLYGGATVTQQTINLTADYIIIDWDNNVVTAQGRKDSTGAIIGRPNFKDGEEGFTSLKMRYNFKTKKGKVFDAITQENDLFIHGENSKIIQDAFYDEKDSTYRDVIYNRDAVFTTCNHEHPHFGIHAKKLKMIPDKIAVVGPANLELAGVPTPLYLPFGFFPLKQGERTGLIFPRDIDVSQEWGVGLKEVGWYFPLSDNWDMKITGDIYFAGTWGLRINSRYKYRYRNSGNFTLSYSDRVIEQADASIDHAKSISLRWSHAQDASAHPSRRISASVNIQTNGFQSRNFNDAESVLNNSLSSNISYTKMFPNKPFTLTANMNHSQNTRSHIMTFNLPTLGFNMNRIYPFEKKNRTGKQKWYERVTLKYDARAENRFTTTDTTLFTPETLESAQYGIKQDVRSDVSFKLFKYINIAPGITYNEVWYGNEINREFNNTPTIDTTVFTDDEGNIIGTEIDTTSYGALEDEKINGFSRYFQFTANLSANTTLYATKIFEKGKIRGLRHVFQPNISFNYTPDYTDPSFGFYKEAITPANPENTIADTVLYSVFEGGIYGAPGRGGRQMSLSYGASNNFEMKVFSKRDSSTKKIKLMDNIRVGGNYNFAADSLNFSPVSMSGTTRLFKGLSTMNLSATWDPYAAYVSGTSFRRTDEFYYDTDGKFLRFDEATLRLNTGMTIKKFRELFQRKKDDSDNDNREEEFENREDQLGEFNTDRDSRQVQDEQVKGETGPRGRKSDKPTLTNTDFFGLFDNFRIQHNFNLTLEPSVYTMKDTFKITNHTIEIRGNLDITEKWKVTVGRIGYNFTQKRITYPDFSFYRDLHCWEMGMSWRPDRDSYSFFLRVKPSSLDFIELPYKKNPIDGRFGGF